MSDQERDDRQVAQKRDAILRKLLQTPPQPRAETSERARRAKDKPRRGRPPKLRKPA